MDTTAEFEPDVQSDNHNAIDVNVDSEIVIPDGRPFIMMMFDTDKMIDDAGAGDIIDTIGREECIVDDLILCEDPATYLSIEQSDYVSDNNDDSTKINNISDFDGCCMNGLHNKMFFMQEHNDKNGGIRGIVKRSDRKIGLAQQMMMMKLVG